MSDIPTSSQVSSGGVAFRKKDSQIEVAIISVGEEGRWQLPKGQVDRGESEKETALREVREEAGIQTELVDLIDKIDYWFYTTSREKRTRIHKYVYFFLLRYLAGSTHDHDDEVNEARWVEIDQAVAMLAFDSEKKMVQKAKELIQELE